MQPAKFVALLSAVEIIAFWFRDLLGSERRDFFKPDYRAYDDDLLSTGITNTNAEGFYQFGVEP
ncbi:MAG: hypothetical protein HOM55_03370 [Proteobacteria bacterium]|nr:hypothetical protein [Pseudomonadota bacterium]